MRPGISITLKAAARRRLEPPWVCRWLQHLRVWSLTNKTASRPSTEARTSDPVGAGSRGWTRITLGDGGVDRVQDRLHTSGAARLSSWKEKGSNDRPSNADAWTTVQSPL